MTHKEKRERRKLIMEEVAAGVPIVEIAKKHGLEEGTVRAYSLQDFVEAPTKREERWELMAEDLKTNSMIFVANKYKVGTDTIYKVMRQFGMPIRPKGRPKGSSLKPLGERFRRFANVDWSEADTTISDALGCSRERIRQVRKALGLEPSRGNTHLRKENRKIRGQIALAILNGEDTKVIAKKFKCSKSYVCLACKEYGVKMKSRGKSKLPNEKKATRFNHVDWSKPYTQIAEEEGVSICRIMQVKRLKGFSTRGKCSHCGAILQAKDGRLMLAPTHDFPVPCRSVCPGSGLRMEKVAYVHQDGKENVNVPPQ